jgi:uncharacterized protein
MTPQERDLITALLGRLKQQGGQPKDAEAEALIRQSMTELPDAPYLLVQTVLIQDMALNSAQGRISELERQLADAKASSPPTSFLGGAGRGSVPPSGAWTRSAPAAPAAAFTPSGAAPAAAPSPWAAPSAGSGFLRQAAATAAGIAGGALLFQGIESLLGPHWGGGAVAGTTAQPGLSETVVNNYYGDQSATSSATEADAGSDQDQDYASDQDLSNVDVAADEDFGGDDSFDV